MFYFKSFIFHISFLFFRYLQAYFLTFCEGDTLAYARNLKNLSQEELAQAMASPANAGRINKNGQGYL